MSDKGKNPLLDKVANSVANLDLEHIKDVVKETLDVGVSPYEIAAKGLGKGMDIVGKKYRAMNTSYQSSLLQAK